MAILNKKRQKVSDSIPTSSMADIAFLLLIFFLVTTTFDEEMGLQVVLPERADDAEQRAEAEQHPARRVEDPLRVHGRSSLAGSSATAGETTARFPKRAQRHTAIVPVKLTRV